MLLSANVGFLAIQSVDSSDMEHYSSGAQTMSYLSIATTVGSILLGLRLLLRQTEKMNNIHNVVKLCSDFHTFLAFLTPCRTTLKLEATFSSASNFWLSYIAFRMHCSCGRRCSLPVVPYNRTDYMVTILGS